MKQLMPMQSTNGPAAAAVLLATVMLAGCTTERTGFADPFAPVAPAPVAAAKPAPPPVNMAGRWILAGTNGGQCGMNFTAAPGASSGKIAPEGGCPGNFFTSRQWAFEQGALVIYNHKDQTLARLAMSPSMGGQFDGTAVSGLVVHLSR
jgi:hypothetical protein